MVGSTRSIPRNYMNKPQTERDSCRFILLQRRGPFFLSCILEGASLRGEATGQVLKVWGRGRELNAGTMMIKEIILTKYEAKIRHG